jgi:hypothetical protein
LSGVTLPANSVIGGLTVTASVVLTAAAPADGAVVTLTSSSDAAIVPATVTIASGSTTQAFDIQTVATPGTTSATITASYAGVSKTATFTIGKLALQALSLSASTAIGGSRLAGTISLAAAAPGEGVQVLLASSSPTVVVPTAVTIPGGDTARTFDIVTLDSPAPVVATITATLAYSGSTKTATLTVARLALQSVSFGIDAVPGGLQLTGTVALTVATPVDAIVSLSSNSAAATVPPSATVPTGAISQTFEISTVNEPPTKTVTIVAGYAGTRQSATLTVIAYPKIAALTCPSTTIKGGTTMQCTARLATPAPPGGWQIALSTSDDSLASVPDTVAVRRSSRPFSSRSPRRRLRSPCTQPSGSRTRPAVSFSFHKRYPSPRNGDEALIPAQSRLSS